MSDDLTTRARAIWHDMKYEEDLLAALIKALRDERRRVWECVLHEAMRHGLDSGMSFVQWLRHQAEAPHG